jgi:hypothetical protein
MSLLKLSWKHAEDFKAQLLVDILLLFKNLVLAVGRMPVFIKHSFY